MGATLRALSAVFQTPSKTIVKLIHSLSFNPNLDVRTKTFSTFSSLLILHCQCHKIIRQRPNNNNNHILKLRNSCQCRSACRFTRMLSSNNEKESPGDSLSRGKVLVIEKEMQDSQRNTNDNDCDKASDSPSNIILKEEERAGQIKDVQLNKKGQVLSNRAKRRLTRIELIKKRATNKKEKQQRKLSAPNADQNAGFGEDIFSETEYYFENGLRKVYPYYYTFNAFAKRRWLGRQLIDVFAAEFRAENKEFYEEAIRVGALTVNGSPISLEYTLKEGDLVQNTIHRHENPVTDRPLRIIHEDEDVLVVDKPSSIPCHPCGRYRFNSIVFILGKEAGRPNLRNIYRLDRLTSGVMVCGKTARRTAELEQHVLKREVEKEYVCRVVGEFPDGRICVKEPLDVLSNRVAVWKVSTNGKPSQTFFEKMSFNGKTSVVKCFPIVNDPIYNSQAFGPLRGKGGDYGKTEQEVIDEIEKFHNVGEWEAGDNPLFDLKLTEKRSRQNNTNEKMDMTGTADSDVNVECSRGEDVTNMADAGDAGCPGTTGFDSNTRKSDIIDNLAQEASLEPSAKRLKVTERSDRPGFDLDKWEVDERCRACRRQYLDPSPENLTMYLHALRYKGPDWDYSTELPHWAQPDFIEEKTDI